MAKIIDKSEETKTTNECVFQIVQNPFSPSFIQRKNLNIHFCSIIDLME